MRILLLAVFHFFILHVAAQPTRYTTTQIHAHNDYEKLAPFLMAYHQRVGSIEVDVFLHEGELVVAHDSAQLLLKRGIEELYLRPLSAKITANNGKPYTDNSLSLQLMVDIKSPAVPTLKKLTETLVDYPVITGSSSIKIVISGNRPDSTTYTAYPSFIRFDGELSKDYPAAVLERIEMMSDNFKNYSSWNGKGTIPAAEKKKLQAAIRKAHAAGKRVRFWNAPDIVNSWHAFMDLGVDYINTDQVTKLGNFINNLPDRTYTAVNSYVPYNAKRTNDGTNSPVKNVILFIGDGCGLAQLYAGYTANRGALNVFNMRYTGLSKTSSFDSYITDSAPGSTAFSSGEKTNNRAVGVDHTGKALALLPDILLQRKIRTGIVTTGDVRDATPADFYAHQIERSNFAAIEKDLALSSVHLLMGSGKFSGDAQTINRLHKKFSWKQSLADVNGTGNEPLLLTDSVAGLSVEGGRGTWLNDAFAKATSRLVNPNGFLLVVEGAQIDHGGHANRLPYVVNEVLDFDRAVGEAMRFADSNGETLVIVTADHETGGLTLTAGDYNKGYVAGEFSTEDHTAVPVPVFAYGPQAQLFTGVYENTEIFYRMVKALQTNGKQRSTAVAKPATSKL